MAALQEMMSCGSPPLPKNGVQQVWAVNVVFLGSGGPFEAGLKATHVEHCNLLDPNLTITHLADTQTSLSIGNAEGTHAVYVRRSAFARSGTDIVTGMMKANQKKTYHLEGVPQLCEAQMHHHQKSLCGQRPWLPYRNPCVGCLNPLCNGSLTKVKRSWGLIKRSFTWGDHQKDDVSTTWDKLPMVKPGAEGSIDQPPVATKAQFGSPEAHLLLRL